MSQLGLAVDAEISTRHLSFVETGRAQPSREMVLHLAEQLDVPLRDRNVLLAAAGYAPVFAERSFDDPALETARRAVELVLKGHEPYPALTIDRHWTLLASNAAVPPLLTGAAPKLVDLLAELRACPVPHARRADSPLYGGIVIPFRLATRRVCSRSSAPRPCLGHRSTSRSRNWRSSRFFPPMPRPPRPCTEPSTRRVRSGFTLSAPPC